MCLGTQTANQTLPQLFRKTQFSASAKESTEIAENPTSWAFKICGMSEYLDPETQLSKFIYIRDCLRKRVQIELVMVALTPELAAQLKTTQTYKVCFVSIINVC